MFDKSNKDVDSQTVYIFSSTDGTKSSKKIRAYKQTKEAETPVVRFCFELELKHQKARRFTKLVKQKNELYFNYLAFLNLIESIEALAETKLTEGLFILAGELRAFLPAGFTYNKISPLPKPTKSQNQAEKKQKIVDKKRKKTSLFNAVQENCFTFFKGLSALPGLGLTGKQSLMIWYIFQKYLDSCQKGNSRTKIVLLLDDSSFVEKNVAVVRFSLNELLAFLNLDIRSENRKLLCGELEDLSKKTFVMEHKDFGFESPRPLPFFYRLSKADSSAISAATEIQVEINLLFLVGFSSSFFLVKTKLIANFLTLIREAAFYSSIKKIPDYSYNFLFLLLQSWEKDNVTLESRFLSFLPKRKKQKEKMLLFLLSCLVYFKNRRILTYWELELFCNKEKPFTLNAETVVHGKNLCALENLVPPKNRDKLFKLLLNFRSTAFLCSENEDF